MSILTPDFVFNIEDLEEFKIDPSTVFKNNSKTLARAQSPQTLKRPVIGLPVPNEGALKAPKINALFQIPVSTIKAAGAEPKPKIKEPEAQQVSIISVATEQATAFAKKEPVLVEVPSAVKVETSNVKTEVAEINGLKVVKAQEKTVAVEGSNVKIPASVIPPNAAQRSIGVNLSKEAGALGPNIPVVNVGKIASKIGVPKEMLYVFAGLSAFLILVR